MKCAKLAVRIRKFKRITFPGHNSDALSLPESNKQGDHLYGWFCLLQLVSPIDFVKIAVVVGDNVCIYNLSSTFHSYSWCITPFECQHSSNHVDQRSRKVRGIIFLPRAGSINDVCRFDSCGNYKVTKSYEDNVATRAL